MKIKNNPYKSAIFKGIQLAVVFIVIIAVAGIYSFGWFAQNKQVTGDGMSIEVDVKNLEFGDELKLTRNYSGSTTDGTVDNYRKDSGKYYLYSQGKFIDADGNDVSVSGKNKVPLGISAFLPGEYIRIELSVINTGTSPVNLSFGFGNVTADNFTVKQSETQTYDFSTLMIYRWNLISVANVTAVNESGWFSDCAADAVTCVPKSTIEVVSSRLFVPDSPDGNSATVIFTITADTSQYYANTVITEYGASNLLSEKNINIGKMYISGV